ncbi:FAD-dependent oxidoreductase [bacterium]|nr:FAD-dependent oxidoreductase [bacterium]MBU1652101.1 FAD-dependent oxidoreductase [bacterium]
MNANAKSILIIGGGIAGITAAVDAAEVGYQVILVEKEAYLGGRVMQMHRYFPKMCPPTCGFEINVRRIKQNPRITVHTLASVEEISGEPGNFKAKVKIDPRYVTGVHAIDDSIAEQLQSERPNDFNYAMENTKALYLPHDMAYPPMYVLDREILSDTDVERLKHICPADTIDMEMMAKTLEIEVGSVIIATGWKPYDTTNLDSLGGGQFQNVISNVMLERLIAPGGPTQGKIVRSSDDQKPGNIAFVQCAGSRDENHLAYCSAVCCMASLKHVRYIREQYESAKITVFYIDIRTIGREEKFYYDLLEDENVSFIKGKVAKINEDASTKNLILDVEDTVSGETLHQNFDMVVLATGMVPNGIDFELPIDLPVDDYGFLIGEASAEGIYSVGCAKRPCDVSRSTKDSTAAALKAIQQLNRGD